jgi:putative DNA methylase
VVARIGQSGHTRLVEKWFPYIAVSRLVASDRRSKDPVYGVHKWFARRPPTLVRALLLASHLDDGTDEDVFWARHASPGRWLADAVVYDPFMGGGTSLVESARMGAAVVGRDVDPIAVAVVGAELLGPDPGFAQAVDHLVRELESEFGQYFLGPEPEWIPLHWFWLARPVCGHCGQSGLLYKDLILATSSGQHGAVVRDDKMHAFCPDCLTVYPMGLLRKEVRCCGRRHRIHHGTYEHGKYRCRYCGEASTHEELRSADAERVLVAVEETRLGAHRRIRTTSDYDRVLTARALSMAEGVGEEFDVQLETDRRDRRPVNAGFTSVRTLFTPRQWAVVTSAFSKVRAANYPAQLECELTLMLTGALSSNNALCGYARDWGRLAPLFSVRGFALPALTVELNPFHSTGGRGTFRSARARMTDRSQPTVRRGRIVGGQIERLALDLPVQPSSIDVACRSADDTAGQDECVGTICVTDPPYFDYIAYSELSEFFRVWLREPGLAGAPLLPDSDSPVETFATGLGGALKSTLARLGPGTPLVFTYHSSNPDAWAAIGSAFDIANLSVVALWPVLADPHMGHHTADGNCEWDVVVVARRTSEVEAISTEPDVPLTAWLTEIERASLRVGEADRASFEQAWLMAKSRLAQAPTMPRHRKP